MNYIFEDLTADDCLMIQQTIVDYLNETEEKNLTADGVNPRITYQYKTPFGEINKGNYWMVDRTNNSWFVQVNSGMLEITTFILFFNGVIYPIRSLYLDAGTLESLSYIKDPVEREVVEEIVIDCVSELGYTMDFNGDC
ncbi:hypothetical protein [Spartinivicinus poritis]|uniref:Uncharacterized protein n=1 Tax=Spartinivicinus poritis TaxID=2994640 RepID=A0ABT5UG83_9GAMM|nr:hypothetical protein [Spartinivicinus sp. A2-2]MDE1464084.1 hypothetical protein [Spartinivicinus sp. A2-2]